MLLSLKIQLFVEKTISLCESGFNGSFLELLYHFLVFEYRRLLLRQLMLQLSDFTSEEFAVLLTFTPLALHVFPEEAGCYDDGVSLHCALTIEI